MQEGGRAGQVNVRFGSKADICTAIGHVRFTPNSDRESGHVGNPIAAVERELIIETLIDQRGSRTEAAKLLGISLRTLRNKICEYNDHGIIVTQPMAWRVN
jgi:DNA-binding NtrC family response regulator